MKIDIERNPESDEFPYTARLEIVTATVDAGFVFQAPVAVVYAGTQKLFEVSICGYKLQTEHPAELPALIGTLLSRLIYLARLPSYVFIARRAGQLFPVYTIDHDVIVTTPGGPLFRHVELAKVREYLTDYLHEASVLGKTGLSDKLHVRGVSMRTLGLRRPIFYLKKRIPGQTDFWAPVFESANGKSIYTYAVNARREVPVAAGAEVLFLRQTVANALRADGRLHDSLDLRPDRLFPHYWERLQSNLTPQETITVHGISLPLYQNGNNDRLMIGLETRPDENRYSLFLGKDVDDVRRRAAQDFARRGLAIPQPAVSA